VAGSSVAGVDCGDALSFEPSWRNGSVVELAMLVLKVDSAICEFGAPIAQRSTKTRFGESTKDSTELGFVNPAAKLEFVLAARICRQGTCCLSAATALYTFDRIHDRRVIKQWA
jgi:hypothetical protein